VTGEAQVLCLCRKLLEKEKDFVNWLAALYLFFFLPAFFSF